MSEIRKIRSDSANFDLIIPDVVPDYYADGIHTAQVGVPFAKIVFHRVRALATDEQIAAAAEPREIAFQVTMPVASLLEFAKNVIESTTQNRPFLDNAMDVYKTHLNKFLDVPNPSEVSPATSVQK